MNQTITNDSPKELLQWIKQRLKFKYNDDLVADSIDNIFQNYEFLPKKLPLSLVEKICRRHYPDFDLERTPDMNMGYTNKERLQIKNLIIDIISDTIFYKEE